MVTGITTKDCSIFGCHLRNENPEAHHQYFLKKSLQHVKNKIFLKRFGKFRIAVKIAISVQKMKPVAKCTCFIVYMFHI